MFKRLYTKEVVIPLFLIAEVLTLFGAWYVFSYQGLRFCTNKYYAFIDKDYRCPNPQYIDKREYSSLRADLKKYINQATTTGKVSLVSVYFRDLEDGPTMSINGSKDYIPASLLKLPLALTFYKAAENNPSILHATVSADSLGPVPTQDFVPAETLEEGKSYTVRDLIRRALVYSDNLSSQLLYQHLGDLVGTSTALQDTYRSLGIMNPKSLMDAPVLNGRDYTELLRMLYNIAYLNRDYSEEVLEFLAQSRFDQGLRAGVPADVVIANKFGERFLRDGTKELHDCGIVYFPQNPYALCVMTQGIDFDSLSAVIGDVSKAVYDEVNKRRL